MLEARLPQPSRVAARKLTDPARLRVLLDEHGMFELSHPSDLSIDNADLAPAVVAAQIAQAFDLGNARHRDRWRHLRQRPSQRTHVGRTALVVVAGSPVKRGTSSPSG